jgi:hypothetical protein
MLSRCAIFACVANPASSLAFRMASDSCSLGVGTVGTSRYVAELSSDVAVRTGEATPFAKRCHLHHLTGRLTWETSHAVKPARKAHTAGGWCANTRTRGG